MRSLGNGSMPDNDRFEIKKNRIHLNNIEMSEIRWLQRFSNVAESSSELHHNVVPLESCDSGKETH